MFQVFQMQKAESSDKFVLGESSRLEEPKHVKKRTRILQSCIPCHQARRKCDRERPCGRCVNLRMEGQCIYQTEGTAPRQAPEQDELAHLRERVSALEQTVRVLVQKLLSKGVIDSSGLEADETDILPQEVAEDPGASEEQGRQKRRKIPERAGLEHGSTPAVELMKAGGTVGEAD